MDFELKRRIEKLNVLLDRVTRRMQVQFGKSKNCVLGNDYEHSKWEILKINEPALGKQDKEGTALLPTWAQLSEDLYSALHRTHTVLFDEDQIHPKWRGNRKLLAELINTNDYERVHDITMGDANMVVVAALRIQEGWIEELKKQKEENKQRGPQGNEGSTPGDGQDQSRQPVQSGSGEQPAGGNQNPGGDSSGIPGQAGATSGEAGDHPDQTHGDPTQGPDGSQEGGGGEQETPDAARAPEPNNSLDQYDTGLAYTRAAEAAQLAVEEAERLAEAAAGGSSIEDAIARAEAALEASGELEERLEDQRVYNELTQDRDQMTEALKKAVRAAVQEAGDQIQTLHAWGVEKGMLRGMDPKEAMELSKLMRESPELKRIAQLIGNNRLSIQHRKVKEQLANGPTVRVGVETGRNLNKLRASQKLMMVTSPSMFRWKFANNQLQQYKTKMELWQDEGTGVIWVDSSGSMWSGSPFTYSQVAKATAISIMEYLHDQGRDCVLGLFDHGVREVLEVPKHATPLEMLRAKVYLATHDYGGGTDFFEPLVAGFTKIKETPYLEHADQVLITDGQCYLSEEQVEEIKELQEETRVNIQTVLMPGGHASQMEQFGPVNSVSTSLNDAAKLALDIVEKMEDGYQE